jgi:hypothetical protein
MDAFRNNFCAFKCKKDQIASTKFFALLNCDCRIGTFCDIAAEGSFKNSFPFYTPMHPARLR